MKVSRIILFMGALMPLCAVAHGGGLDGYGCHHNRKQGGYHCHRGENAGKQYATKADMLKDLPKAQK